MAETSVLGGVIQFMGRIGVYDVVLPFLLTFTVVYAIFEKTAVLGKETLGDKEVTRKNLNAMTAFTIAFMVVASSKIVEVITAVSSKVVVLLFLVVFFLMLIGTFYGKSEEVILAKDSWWRTVFTVIMFVGIALIFFDSITIGNQSILQWLWSFLSAFWTSTAVASVIFIAFLIGFISYLTSG